MSRFLPGAGDARGALAAFRPVGQLITKKVSYHIAETDNQLEPKKVSYHIGETDNRGVPIRASPLPQARPCCKLEAFAKSSSSQCVDLPVGNVGRAKRKQRVHYLSKSIV